MLGILPEMSPRRAERHSDALGQESGTRSPCPVILEVLPHTASHGSHGVTFGAGLGHPGTGDGHHLGLRLHP